MRAALLLPLAIAATPAMAQEMKPIVDARLRYEGVDQAGFAQDADALTLRLRAGFELKQGDFTLLAEGEGTLALGERYNSTVNGRTAYPTVADPENVEINRIQLQYRGIKDTVFTAGRQRIALDDQRFRLRTQELVVLGVDLRLQGKRCGVECHLGPGARLLHRHEVDDGAGGGDQHDGENAEQHEERAAFIALEALEQTFEAMQHGDYPGP